VGNTIYFLSDRNGLVSLFAYDTATRKVSEALKSEGFDFKSASAGPDAIIIALHGATGEDGSLRGVLDLCGVPYVGPDARAAPQPIRGAIGEPALFDRLARLLAEHALVWHLALRVISGERSSHMPRALTPGCVNQGARRRQLESTPARRRREWRIATG